MTRGGGEEKRLRVDRETDNASDGSEGLPATVIVNFLWCRSEAGIGLAPLS